MWEIKKIGLRCLKEGRSWGVRGWKKREGKRIEREKEPNCEVERKGNYCAYFNQQTGALHAVHLSKSSFWCFNIFFHKNKEKECKNMQKLIKILPWVVWTWIYRSWWTWLTNKPKPQSLLFSLLWLKKMLKHNKNWQKNHMQSTLLLVKIHNRECLF